MADTRQVVSWSLERKCRFRSGDAWESPGRTSQQLWDLRTLSRGISDSRVIDGICITSWTLDFDRRLRPDDITSCLRIPCDGFRVSERFEKYGGLEASLDTCGICEANATSDAAKELAQCHGYLTIDPDSTELETRLDDVIKRRQLETQIWPAFLKTAQIWYGLWINTPLRCDQAKFLIQLLGAAFQGSEQTEDGLGHFLRALDITRKLDIPLHVSLAPPGHTDFGWYTVFPHCPRCKANARLERWKSEYPRDIHQCLVCGHSFIPGDTHRMVRMDTDDVHRTDDPIEEQLGPTGYPNFVRKSIVLQGFSQDQAEVAWQDELERRAMRSKRSTEELDENGPTCPTCGKPSSLENEKMCFECGATWQ